MNLLNLADLVRIAPRLEMAVANVRGECSKAHTSLSADWVNQGCQGVFRFLPRLPKKPKSHIPSRSSAPDNGAVRLQSGSLLGGNRQRHRKALREVLSDEQVAEAIGLALGAVAELRVEGKR